MKMSTKKLIRYFECPYLSVYKLSNILWFPWRLVLTRYTDNEPPLTEMKNTLLNVSQAGENGKIVYVS